MKTALKIVGIMAVVAGLGLGGQALANCQNEGPFEIIQCGTQNWFAPPPAGTGTITARWWQLGFGNANNPLDPTYSIGIDGSGMYYYAYATPPSTWVGVDSGVAVLDIAPAEFIGGPPGALCFSSAANWAAPGVDGCADNNRRATTVPAIGVNVSDTWMNRYFAGSTPGVLRYSYQVDAPMATLLTESNGLNFALAFFATQTRNKDSNDLLSGGFQMGALINGDPNPVRVGQNNIVPWQPVPKPNISATFVDPNNTGTSDRILAVSWTPIRLVHDGTNRPCKTPTNVPCTTLGTLAGNTVGVGVLDQGPLAHYVVEQTPFSGGACGQTWTAVGSMVNHPDPNTTVTVAPNTCVRLKTIFGRTPQAQFDENLIPALPNWDAAVRGKLGDVGYHVVSTPTIIGSALVSQKAVLTVIEKNKNTYAVTWNTTTELNITGFDIVGIDQKGGTKVLKTTACTSCTTGLGQFYTELIPAGQLQGTKKIQVVIKPSGDTSNILDVK